MATIRLRDGSTIEVDPEAATELREIWADVGEVHPAREIGIEASDGTRHSVALGDVEAIDE